MLSDGPALIDKQFTVLPLTAPCLSPLPKIKSGFGHVRKLLETWVRQCFFAGNFGFSPPFVHYYTKPKWCKKVVAINNIPVLGYFLNKKKHDFYKICIWQYLVILFENAQMKVLLTAMLLWIFFKYCLYNQHLQKIVKLPIYRKIVKTKLCFLWEFK